MQDFTAEEPHLSTLDQIAPQSYTRFILCFGLDSGLPHDEAIQTLMDGLKATADQIPALRSLVVSVTDSNGRETKDLRPGHVTMFNAKDLRSSWLDFGEIQRQGFPSHVFDGETLCPTGVWAVPGSPVATFLAQANLITGGLLLGLSVWHGAFDGTSDTEILRIWAQNCRDLGNGGSINSRTLSAAAFDNSRLSKVSGAEKRGSPEDHPEFLLLPEAPTALPPVMALTLKTQIFKISPPSISALKDLASPTNCLSPQKEYSWISTHTAVSALIWRSIMAATYAHEHPITDSLSIFALPLNARKRMDPPLPPDLLACAWCFQESRLPTNTLLEANLADIAIAVRKGNDGVDASYMDSLIDMIDGVPDLALLIPTSFPGILRTSVLLTSWAKFAMYDFDWGTALGGKCKRVRTAASGMFNGMQVVLPKLPEEMGGGLEIVVGLEDEAMERLKMDDFWMKFTTLV